MQHHYFFGSTNLGASHLPTYRCLLIILGITCAHCCNPPYHHCCPFRSGCLRCLWMLLELSTGLLQRRGQMCCQRQSCLPLPLLHVSLGCCKIGFLLPCHTIHQLCCKQGLFIHKFVVLYYAYLAFDILWKF